MENDSDLGKRLAELRKRKTAEHQNGMTQEQLASAAGVHKNTVCHAERTGDIRVSTLRAFARALRVDLSDLLGHASKSTRRRRATGSESRR